MDSRTEQSSVIGILVLLDYVPGEGYNPPIALYSKENEAIAMQELARLREEADEKNNDHEYILVPYKIL